jgi:malonyl CoA-acyl carrier protein transacylase
VKTAPSIAANTAERNIGSSGTSLVSAATTLPAASIVNIAAMRALRCERAASSG